MLYFYFEKRIGMEISENSYKNVLFQDSFALAILIGPQTFKYESLGGNSFTP